MIHYVDDMYLFVHHEHGDTSIYMSPMDFKKFVSFICANVCCTYKKLILNNNITIHIEESPDANGNPNVVIDSGPMRLIFYLDEDILSGYEIALL